MADVATKVVLPMFKARNKPFVLVYWSRDPDGSQHNTGDSLNTITPGHQRPDLDGRHQERRQQSGAIAQGARRARACRLHQHHRLLRSWFFDHLEGEQDQPVGEDLLRRHAEGLPADGLCLAIDLAKALNLPLYDPNDKNAKVADNAHPKAGNGLLGENPGEA